MHLTGSLALLAVGFATALWILIRRIFRPRHFPLHRVLLAGGSIGLGYGFTLGMLFARFGILTAHALGLIVLSFLSCAFPALLLRDSAGAKLGPGEIARLASANTLVGLALATLLLLTAGFLLAMI